MNRAPARRRAERPHATVVLSDNAAHVEGVDPDDVQLVALSAGLDHRWTGTGWAFAPGDVLPLAAALRAGGRAVRLATRAVS